MDLDLNIDLKAKLTQEQFGEIVGVSRQAIGGLIKRGVLEENGQLQSWLIDYCSNLREQAAGRAGMSGGLDLVEERARLAKEQADKFAFQNAITRNELAPVTLIEEVLARAASRIAGIFDSIPGMVKRRVPSLPIEAIELLAAEIIRARNVVAAMSLENLKDDFDIETEGENRNA